MNEVVNAIQNGNTRLLLLVALIVVVSALSQVILSYYVGERLKAKINSDSDARLESLRSDLSVVGRARDKKQDVLIEMIDVVGSAQVATAQLVRAHQDPTRPSTRAWEVWQQRAEELADFTIKYRSPYMHDYSSEIDTLLKSFDEIPETLRAAKASGGETYTVSFAGLLTTCDTLKDTLFSDCVDLAEHGTGL